MTNCEVLSTPIHDVKYIYLSGCYCFWRNEKTMVSATIWKFFDREASSSLIVSTTESFFTIMSTVPCQTQPLPKKKKVLMKINLIFQVDMQMKYVY